MGHTTISISRDLRDTLVEDKEDHESWDDYIRRLYESGGDADNQLLLEDIGREISGARDDIKALHDGRQPDGSQLY